MIDSHGIWESESEQLDPQQIEPAATFYGSFNLTRTRTRTRTLTDKRDQEPLEAAVSVNRRHGAIVEIELCLFDVLVCTQISYVSFRTDYSSARPARRPGSRAPAPRRENPEQSDPANKGPAICQGGCANLFITRQICVSHASAHTSSPSDTPRTQNSPA